MHRPRIVAALTLAAAMLTLAATPGLAQPGQVPLPGAGFKPPPPPPIKPYQTVPVTPPPRFDDASFSAFRKQLEDIVAHKDRAALAKIVSAQNFFWVQDKDLADKRKSGIDNLARAIDLDAKDGSGWEVVLGYANEPTAAELPQQKGVFCAPADPIIDPQAFDALGKATQTDPSQWGFPLKDGLDVHAAAQASSPVIEKLGMTLVRVMPDSTPPANANEPFFLHVATPAGKSGYVDAQAVSPLGGDQMCYAKGAGGWQIVGYFGGAAQ